MALSDDEIIAEANVGDVAWARGFKQGLKTGQSAATPSASVERMYPATCDGKEQYAFEEWAKREGFDMVEHPIHYLFLNERTDAARKAWKAGLTYAVEQVRTLPVPSAPQGGE